MKLKFIPLYLNQKKKTTNFCQGKSVKKIESGYVHTKGGKDKSEQSLALDKMYKEIKLDNRWIGATYPGVINYLSQ